MAKLEAAHSAAQGHSETHTQELQEKLERAQEAVRQLEIRRALDQEGWDSDVTLLRRQMSAVDRWDPPLADLTRRFQPHGPQVASPRAPEAR